MDRPDISHHASIRYISLQLNSSSYNKRNRITIYLKHLPPEAQRTKRPYFYSNSLSSTTTIIMAAEVLRECAIWLRQQNSIQHVCTSNGGWERWAHLDFGAFLKSKNFKVTHDDRCFAENSDITNFTVQDVACVELKTLGYQFNALELIQAYKTRMNAAQQKFGRYTLNDECEENDKFCVGIARESDVVLGLRYLFNNNNICATNFMKIMKGVFGPEYEHAVVTSISGARWIVSFCKVD